MKMIVTGVNKNDIHEQVKYFCLIVEKSEKFFCYQSMIIISC